MVILIDGVKYVILKPKSEKEFRKHITEHAKEIFGQNTLYLAITPQLRSDAGLGSKPDGFLLDLLKKKLYVIEVELSSHNPYSHIINQLTRFLNGIDNPRTANSIVNALYDRISENSALQEHFEVKTGEALHRGLAKLLISSPGIVVLIDEKTSEVIEACKILIKGFDTHILEFQTFTKEGDLNCHVHRFESFMNDVGKPPSLELIKNFLVQLDQTDPPFLLLNYLLAHETTYARDAGLSDAVRLRKSALFNLLKKMQGQEILCQKKKARRKIYFINPCFNEIVKERLLGRKSDA